MACEFNITKISTYLDGELPRAEQLELEKHLASCENCRAELEELKKNESLLSKAFKNHPFGNELADQIKRSLPKKEISAVRRVRYALYAAAACITIATAVVLFTTIGKSTPETPEVASRTYSNFNNETKTVELDGIAAVTLNRGARIEVGKETTDTVVRLVEGQIFVASIEGRKEEIIVRTQEAWMRPVGTKFDVERSERAGVFVTVLSVIEGRVEMRTQKYVEVVEAGQQSSVANGYAPQSGSAGAARETASWILGPSNAGVQKPGVTPSGSSGAAPVVQSDGGISTPPDNSIGEPDFPARPKGK